MIPIDQWRLKINDKVFGPYTTEQLRKFAHEGRFAAWSMVAPAGADTWRRASDETTFANFFGKAAKQGQDRKFGRRDQFQPTESDQQQEAPKAAKPRALNTQKRTQPAASGAANFIIVFDTVSAAASKAGAVIQSVGAGFRLTENVWALTCNMTAVGVRNAIAPHIAL